MKFVILMNDNSYVGREYINALNAKGIDADIVCIGNYPVQDEQEDQRCNKLWNPPIFAEVAKNRNVYRFHSLKSKELLEFIKENMYDVGIQGGWGF